ncbi:hypothetical protein PF002_g15362 [Phytophthora fragariae]|uniref:Uncharacterized protein n=1 Tax=Phytophthora fragariae TaxID=53985 RepID=A0A6A3YSK5_9STRA|nr:hypothetical protein PF002_g15362 [Phytophthora fragariae]
MVSVADVNAVILVCGGLGCRTPPPALGVRWDCSLDFI